MVSHQFYDHELRNDDSNFCQNDENDDENILPSENFLVMVAAHRAIDQISNLTNFYAVQVLF
ncbi:MAG: hypothetical protein Kow00121_30540 [Elainellaceae cyanobacterium]